MEVGAVTRDRSRVTLKGRSGVQDFRIEARI
jgi:hypothetical protein